MVRWALVGGSKPAAQFRAWLPYTLGQFKQGRCDQMTNPRERAATVSSLLARLKLDGDTEPAEIIARRMHEAQEYMQRQDAYWGLPGTEREMGQRLGYHSVGNDAAGEAE